MPSVILLLAFLCSGKTPVEIVVTDEKSGNPVPCRVHLKDPAGKPVRAAGLPFWRDHFVCPGRVTLNLEPGRYTYEVERGPEYSRASGGFTVGEETEKKRIEAKLHRLFDLSAEGWFCGDLHIHRPPKDIELLMDAEDLDVGPVITWWNNRNHWAERDLPENPLTVLTSGRFVHLMAGEDEREGGALLYFNLRRPLKITGSTREYPSPMVFLAEARKHATVHVDIEKPFWWDVPIWLASDAVDTIGIANNHMCRSQMLANEAWGRPRDSKRLPPPLGNGQWTQEIYYHVLNSGLRLPPSAGSASGVLPNPVVYNRVYVHVEGELSYEKWWQALRAGRSFVTNGPLLRVRVGDDGRLPGAVFKVAAGKKLELEVRADLFSHDPIQAVEIIVNGRVERSLTADQVTKAKGSLGRVAFAASGWFLVRARTTKTNTFRFASTAPYYVELGRVTRRISKASTQFFVDWVEERMGRVARKLPDAEKRREVLEHHRAALRFWQGRLEKANAG